MPKVERDTGNKNRITPYYNTPRHIEQVVFSGANKSTLSPPKDRLISNPFKEPLVPLIRKEFMDFQISRLMSEESFDSSVQNSGTPHGYIPFMWQVDYFLTLLEKCEGKAKYSSRNLMPNHSNHVNGNKSEMSNLWPPGMLKHNEGR